MLKKKVLFWLDAFDKGGIEKVTLDLVNHLNPEKYEITVMQMFKGGDCRSRLKHHIKKRCCFPLFANGISRCFGFLSGSMLHRIFIRKKYDIEIADGYVWPSKIIGGSVNKNSCKIAWIHMDVVTDPATIPEFATEESRKQFYHNFDQIICVSQQCLNSFHRKFGTEIAGLVLYNAIPQDEIIEKSKEPAELSFDPSCTNVITIGAYRPQKGYDRLLEVHRQLIADGFHHHLYILGDGQEKDMIEGFIKQHQLEESIHLLGFRQNPYQFLIQSDFFVCSSRHEAFSTVQAEATILGVPIVTTDCNGTADLLGKSEYGLITENSTEGIYQGMKTFLTNKQLVSEYRIKAKERSDLFKIEHAVKQWEKLLDKS